MDKPQEKRLTPRDARIIAVALLAVAGAVLVLSFQYWESGAGTDQTRSGSIFQGLILKRIELNIREYSTQREKKQPSGGIRTWTERSFEDFQTVRSRPVKYLPTPAPTPLFSVPTNPAFHETLQEQIRSQLEVAGIPVNVQLPPPEEPGKETVRRPPTGPPGNGYLAIDVDAEHAPGIATFQVTCRLYRDMKLPDPKSASFEIPVTTPRTLRYRVRESDFRTAVSYEVEQMVRTYITDPYGMTKDRFRPKTVQR